MSGSIPIAALAAKSEKCQEATFEPVYDTWFSTDVWRASDMDQCVSSVAPVMLLGWECRQTWAAVALFGRRPDAERAGNVDVEKTPDQQWSPVKHAI